jgi:hypothetical protein
MTRYAAINYFSDGLKKGAETRSVAGVVSQKLKL